MACGGGLRTAVEACELWRRWRLRISMEMVAATAAKACGGGDNDGGKSCGELRWRLAVNLEAIPMKFINNLKENLSKTVTIKGPSGGTWKIGIKRIGDTFLFNDGWNEFVKDHSLHENDILIFKYDSDSHFDVLMFDHRNLCEKKIHISLENAIILLRKIMGVR